MQQATDMKCFNRTFMELKSVEDQFTLDRVSILIAPLWN